jgi:hypothetical protein
VRTRTQDRIEDLTRSQRQEDGGRNHTRQHVDLSRLIRGPPRCGTVLPKRQKQAIATSRREHKQIERTLQREYNKWTLNELYIDVGVTRVS